MNELTKVNQATSMPFFTATDFGRMMDCGAFEDMRVELVAGVLEKMAPSHGDHGSINLSAGASLLKAYEGLPFWLAVDLAIKVDDFEIRGADISVVRDGASKYSFVKGSDVVLAVEIAKTTLGRDLGEKIRGYARAGVAHYWVVDLNARVIHIMSEPEDTDYAVREVVPFGTELCPPDGAKPVIIA